MHTQSNSYSLFNELIKTPLIMVGPGIPQGERIDNPVRNVDVAPTLLELAGVDPPDHFQGHTLAPVWTGNETEPRVVLSENGRLRAFIVDGLSTTPMVGV